MLALDYKLSNSILKKFGQCLSPKTKTLYIFAGPNGSGKSTLIANLYLNKKLDVEYVNADIYCNTIFTDILDETERNTRAMFYTTNKVEDYINLGKSFCYETVFSHISKVDLIKKAKENGYKIISTFVYTNSPQINIKRVQKRVKQGGHNVPNEKIISRYKRSLELSKTLKQLSDVYTEFDNSKQQKIITKI
ncbi:MAG: zeta toxin family protein [Clostridia bacterium]|nr:zeta toxin family protein [Clostridia bacterium]